MKLQVSKALITGSSRGIGRGIALKLAEEGVAIAVHYRSDTEAAESTAKLGVGGRAELIGFVLRHATAT